MKIKNYLIVLVFTFIAIANAPFAHATTNSAPVLDASKTPVFNTESEDAAAPSGAVGTLVSDLVDLTPPSGGLDNVTDADADPTGLAITATDTTHMTLFYSLDGGTTWNAMGAVSASSARLLAADSDNRIYAEPTPDFNGVVASAITFCAWDRTSGSDGASASTASNGGTTAFSTVTDTVSLVVTSINDAPVLDASKSPALADIVQDNGAPSGAVGSLVSSLVDSTAVAGGLDNVTDVDSGPELGVAVVAVNPSFTCYYTTNNGTTWIPLGSPSNSSARLLAADSNTRIYCETGGPNEVGTYGAAITIRAWDQTSGTNGGTASVSLNGGTTAFSSTNDGVLQTVLSSSITIYAAPADTGSGDCTTSGNACDLQQALDLADSNANDATIHVASGTYTGTDAFSFDDAGFTSQLILVGAGTGSTFITVSADNGLAIGESGSLEISGIDFKNSSDAGLYIYGPSSLNIHDNKFEGNSNSGLRILHSSGIKTAEITDNVFDTNSSAGYGGGLFIFVNSGSDSLPVTLAGNTFTGNTATGNDGGGAYIVVDADGSDVNATDNTFDANTANDNGGGLYIVTNGNDSDIAVGDTADGNTFDGNSCETAGGGLFIATDGSDSAMTIEYNNFYNNAAGTGVGGGFYADVNASGDSALTILSNIIGDANSGGNSSGTGGGGFLYTHRGLDFEHNKVESNTASGAVGGVQFHLDGGTGASSGTYEIKYNDVLSNEAGAEVGGLDVIEDSAENVEISSNNFLDNTAANGEGGGLRLLQYESGYHAIVTDNLFENNTAHTESGGFDYYSESSFGIRFINNTLIGNEAVTSNGGGANFGFNDVGGEYWIENNIFYGNTAAGSGDDVHMDVSDYFSVDFSYNDYGQLCILTLTTSCSPTDGMFSRYTQIKNITKDPKLNADTAYTLKSNSPAINAGNSNAVSIPDVDLIGNDRVIGKAADMGAYEFTGTPTSDNRVTGSIGTLLPNTGSSNPTCREGQLIKYTSSPAVYIIENCQKRAFESGSLFVQLGYAWTNIVIIPDSEIYASGPDLIGGQADLNPITIDLKFGMSSPQVMLLQKKLQSKSFFPLTQQTTNYFGPITLQAVKDFQKANNILVTGYVGSLTRDKLNH